MSKDVLQGKSLDLIKRIVLSVVLFAISGVLFFAFYYATSDDFVDNERYMLDDHWLVVTDDNVYEDVTLSERQFSIFNKGDTLELSTTLPTGLTIRNPVVRIYSVHSAVLVYVDEECIYEYGLEDVDKNVMLGYGPHYVSLPRDYEGKIMKVKMLVTEDDAFGGVQPLYLTDGASMLQRVLSEGRAGLLISMFLLAFGFLGMLLSAGMITQTSTFFKIFCITAFSLCAGAWTLCNSDMIMCFVTNLKVKVYLEYFFFYFMAIPFLGYFYDVTKAKYPKPIKIFYWIMQGGTIAFFFVVSGLHFANVAHFPMFVRAEHVIIVLIFVFTLVYYLFNILRNKKMDISLMVGIGFGTIVMLAELVRFNVSKYFKGFSGNSFNSYLELATLIIVIALFVDFAGRTSRSVREQAHANALKEMAYIDELTGLANRRKCDEYMQEIQAKKLSYCIVSLDMNNLKKINDTYGHAEGDIVLKAFSEVLSKAFKKANVVGRMGGDEYIVIWAKVTEDEIKYALDKLRDYVIDYNTLHQKPYRLSTAYGWEFGDENSDPQKVYVAADDLMYEHKRLAKLAEQEAKEKGENKL